MSPSSLSTENLSDETVELTRAVPDDIAQSWLNAQCDMIIGTRRGFVVETTGKGGDAALLFAQWPVVDTTVPKKLIDVANDALSEQRVVITSSSNPDSTGIDPETGSCYVASPLLNSAFAGPVAVFELPNSIRHQQQAVTQLLQWGAVWFDLLWRKQHSDASDNHLELIIKLLARSLEHPEFDAAATATVSELATHLACAQVSLGLLKGSSVSVRAISNSSRVDTRLNLTRTIGAAMNEAVDQGATLCWPDHTDGLPHINVAQEVLAREKGVGAVLSTPLYYGVNVIGALTLERDGVEGFDQSCIDTCETLAMLLGPVFALKHEKEQSIVVKVLASLRCFVKQLCGPRHIALKLYALALIAGVTFLSIATGEHRITAQARLEGSIKRVITAPGDGYIASASHRAGDIVQAGDLLARLDDTDLRLEKLKISSQREQLFKEHRVAMTTHDRSATAIVNSRKQQTGAQLALIEAQLLRTRLLAPFAGMVVSGDLSQSIGSPVEKGQILFEIAPLENYRVVLEVDERDVGFVNPSQNGALKLSGLPGTTLPFSIDRVVPLSTPREGRNVFEVHARLDVPTESIRPGMEGIGKIDIDQRKLIWVWTHELMDWLRLTLWTWVS